MKNWALLAVFFGASVTALAEEATLKVEDSFVRAMPPGRSVTAAFFNLDNSGSSDCQLNGVSSNRSERTEIHRHLHENGVMKMRQVDTVKVPAQQKVAFKPGGYHVMLFDVAGLKAGDEVTFTLQFTACGSLTFTAPVKRPGSK